MRELRDRMERAANSQAATTGWGGDGYRRAIRTQARWWAWLERVEDDLARHGY